MAQDGTLTTHVLDTARGQPAAGLEVALYRTEAGVRHLLREAVTNADGRTDMPLIGPGEMVAGLYVLVFQTGAYLARHGEAEPFLDVVQLQFRAANSAARLHVPLLLSPYGCTTYRGS